MAAHVATYEVAGHVSRAVRFLTDVITEFGRRRAARETRRALEMLSDAQLADIGVDRYEITRIR